MKVIEIFGSFSSHMATDARIQKYGLILARTGLQGLSKVNPVAVWVDAALSVNEAVAAYCRYATEKEVTKRLQAETRVLEKEIAVALNRLRLDMKILEEQAADRLAYLNATLDENIVRTSNLTRTIATKINAVKRLSFAVQACRDDAYHDFEELQDLQRSLDAFVRASLLCLVSSVDN